MEFIMYTGGEELEGVGEQKEYNKIFQLKVLSWMN